MTPPLKRIRAMAFALAAAAALAASPADAGLRDSFENARDAVGCAAKATFNPLRVFESGMRNFERMTAREFDRKANRSVKEALDECRAAAESIVSRGLGVEKFAGKARGLAASAKDAADRVAGWFGKGAAPGDRRRALSVGAGERRFYEDAGVLGTRPLPEAKASAPPAGTAASPGGWDDVAPARDPWGRDETALRRYVGEADHGGESGPGYARGGRGGYEEALERLETEAEAERRRAEAEREREAAERAEAQRLLELDAQHRREAARQEQERAQREQERARREQERQLEASQRQLWESARQLESATRTFLDWKRQKREEAERAKRWERAEARRRAAERREREERRGRGSDGCGAIQSSGGGGAIQC